MSFPLPELAPEWALVPEEYHPILKGKTPDLLPDHTETLGFTHDGGIILASCGPASSEGIIHYFKGDPCLLEQVEKIFIEKRKTQIQIHYWEDDPPTVHGDWKGPILYFTLYHFQVQEFHPPWFERDHPFSKEYSLFPWDELTPHEKETIEHHLSQGRFLRTMDPFEHEAEPLNSFGLRYRGEVVGWIITHRVNAETIAYSKLFVDLEHRHKGEVIKLLIKSIKAQQNSPVPYALFKVNHLKTGKRWREFIEKRLTPFARSIRHEFILWKSYS